MTPRALGRALLAYVASMVLLSVVVHRAASLRALDGDHIASAWLKGELVGRAVNAPLPLLSAATTVEEHVIGEGPFLASIEPVFALSFVAGLDGAKATLNGVTVYVTPDELLSRQAYDKGISIPSLSLSLGVNVPLVEALLAKRLDISVPELRERAVLRRIRTERPLALAKGSVATKPEEIGPAILREAALAAARFLARGVGPDGRFRYIVDAPTDRTLSGYDWPRHAGATFFLAQAAQLTPDRNLREAAFRAGRYLREKATQDCGGSKCVGSEGVVDIGSSALAVIAMNELVRAGIDPSFRGSVEEADEVSPGAAAARRGVHALVRSAR